MSEYQEFTGKTVEEALKSAREAFEVARLDHLDFEILTQGSRGVLGMGAEPARIIAAPRSALGGPTPRASTAASAPPAPTTPAAPPREPDPTGPPPEPARAGSSRAPREGDRRRSGRGQPSGEVTQVDRAATAEVEAAVAASAGREAGVDEDAFSPEALAAGRRILGRLVELMGYRARVDISEGPSPRIIVFGADDAEREALGALIGRKGERLSALQHLVNLLLSREMGSWTRVLVDVEDYRGRRERQLVELASRAAERVRETGQMLQLEPMTALERRWVHLALRDAEGVTTQSIGEEPTRRVVVVPT